MKLPRQIWQKKINTYLITEDGRFPEHVSRKDKKLVRRIKRSIVKEATKKEIKNNENRSRWK